MLFSFVDLYHLITYFSAKVCCAVKIRDVINLIKHLFLWHGPKNEVTNFSQDVRKTAGSTD